jgi:hypothetical protein
MKNVQGFAQAPRGLYRSQDLQGNLDVRAAYDFDLIKRLFLLTKLTLTINIFFWIFRVVFCELFADSPCI